mmetsp:Transcript_17576/g.35671  ORF Transcript_17576/g.35671 Transcript_17576/m.35671 type:complete len:106 (-) Transcript_17576:641-958(-)
MEQKTACVFFTAPIGKKKEMLERKRWMDAEERDETAVLGHSDAFSPSFLFFCFFSIRFGLANQSFRRRRVDGWRPDRTIKLFSLPPGDSRRKEKRPDQMKADRRN